MTKLSGEEFRALQEQQKNTKSDVVARIAPLAVAAVVIAGVAFLGGVEYQKGHTSKTTTAGLVANDRTGQGFGGFQGRGGRTGLRGSFGPVTAVTAASITIQDTRSSSAVTYDITANTTVSNNGAAAAVTDIKVGDNVLIRPSSTNAKQATQIVLNFQLPSGPIGGGTSAPGDVQLQTN